MKTSLLIVLLPLLVTACQPDGPEYAEDTDIIVTSYDEGYDFTEVQTFAMPDQIVVDVKIDDGDTTYIYMADLFATPILQTIQENMENFGYMQVGVGENPDLLLTPAAYTSTTYFYSYWYDWWYGGYWGWGWGWYYPPYYTVSSYTTGTMVMVLADPNQASENPINRSPTLWLSVANGLLSGDNDIGRVTEAINQAFIQSPYLKTN